MTDRIKFELLCDLTTDIVGLHQGALSDKTRKQKIHIPRMVASVVARMTNDIHPTIIAGVLDRDRTSILHYEKFHSHNYASFPKYRETFDEVYNAHNIMENCKLVFDDKDDMRMYFIKEGIVEAQKPQVKIKVKSGKVSHTVKTNYFLCSKIINEIKEALKDYSFSIEIKTI